MRRPRKYYKKRRKRAIKTSKLEKRFEVKPTSYLEGIKSIVKSDY